MIAGRSRTIRISALISKEKVIKELLVRLVRALRVGAYQKLQMFNMTEYDRLIWLDTDGILTRQMDHLFQLEGIWGQRDNGFGQCTNQSVKFVLSLAQWIGKGSTVPDGHKHRLIVTTRENFRNESRRALRRDCPWRPPRTSLKCKSYRRASGRVVPLAW